MSICYYYFLWWGFVEFIYVFVCFWMLDIVLGFVNNVYYMNIMIILENGIFLLGLEESFLKGLYFRNVKMMFVRLINFIGGYYDY